MFQLCSFQLKGSGLQATDKGKSLFLKKKKVSLCVFLPVDVGEVIVRRLMTRQESQLP